MEWSSGVEGEGGVERLVMIWGRAVGVMIHQRWRVWEKI